MKKARILYVDDEIGAARLLKLNLEATGRYEVNIQNWPEDALATAHEFKPDLLLLDIIMPRMPGGNVVAAFEHDPVCKDIPIVFFTAAVWRERVQEHDGIICNHPCLAKPAQLDEITAFIDVNLPASVRAELPAFMSAPSAMSTATASSPG